MKKAEMKNTAITEEEYKSRLLAMLTGHIGGHNAIGMAALFEAVYGEPWKNKINDTRRLRYLITGMRNEGVPICSSSDKTAGGYYLAAAGSELTDYTRRAEMQALKMLMRNAMIKKISLPEYMGQLRLNVA